MRNNINILKKKKNIFLALFFIMILILMFFWKNILDFYQDKKYLENIEKKNLVRFEEIKKNIEIEKENLKNTQKIDKNIKIENIFEITWIWKKFINNNFDEYLEIFWKNLDWISNILIKCNWKADSFSILEKNIDENWKGSVSVLITENSLEAWICQVWTEIWWVWIFSEYNLNVKKDKNNIWINLKFITPNSVLSKDGWMMVLQWKWFKKLVAVQIDNWIVLDLEFLEIVNDNVVIVNIPKNIKVWEYFFRFLSEKWVYENDDLKIFIK